MSKFCVGDEVKFIKRNKYPGWSKDLTLGETYKIIKDDTIKDNIRATVSIGHRLECFEKETLMFRAGDRVRCVGNIEGGGCGWSEGRTFIINRLTCGDTIAWEEDTHKNGVYTHHLEKIGGSMYHELKERIENIQEYGKNADDLLEEIGGHRILVMRFERIYGDKNKGQIVIDQNKSAAAWRFPKDGVFPYSSQCEKLTAFKSALLWLLEYSGIKKGLTEEKRRSLQSQMDKLKIQMEDIQKEFGEL